MKKILIIIAALAFLLPTTEVESQVLSESAKRKFTVGVDVFTDLWQAKVESPYLPDGYSNRTINQGATAFFMYNFVLGEKSLSTFSIGLAIRNQNSYSNSVITNVKSDTIIFHKIENLPTDRDLDLAYNRSKINMTYLDLPVEIKFRTEGGFKLGVGLKVGYLIDSKQKYVGEWPVEFTSDPIKYNKVNEKSKGINQLQKWAYGATLRVGYRWVSVFGYYQFSKIFETGRGPDMYPISLGITITPF